MKKTLITLALAFGPALAAAQVPDDISRMRLRCIPQMLAGTCAVENTKRTVLPATVALEQPCPGNPRQLCVRRVPREQIDELRGAGLGMCDLAEVMCRANEQGPGCLFAKAAWGDR